jgi:hypothetical protein
MEKSAKFGAFRPSAFPVTVSAFDIDAVPIKTKTEMEWRR